MKRWMILAFFLLAAGCAGAPVREETSAPVPGEAVVDLRAESYFFSPSHPIVPAGKPILIRIRNEATVIPHSFVLENAGGGVIVRRNLKKDGETLVRISPLPPGRYPFYCDKSFFGMSHRKKGMEGMLEAKGE